MLIHFRLPVRTQSETDVFCRDVDLEKVPKIGDRLKFSKECGPYRVRDVIVETDGKAVCELEHLNEPSPAELPQGILNIQPELWDLATGGWRNEEPTNTPNRAVASERE